MITKTRKYLLKSVVFLTLFTAGCVVGPDYERPQLDVPARWSQQGHVQANASAEVLKAWWKVLNDPVLEELIEKAAQNNLDLKEAYFRIEESRALRDFAAGQYYPGVDFSASYTRSRRSENSLFSLPGTLKERGLYSNGFDALWEVDLFGAFKRAVQSSQASLEASVENYYYVLISLYAEVASSYIEVRTAQMRIQYALENIRSQRDTVQLTQDRFRAGLAPELDVTRAQQNLANTEAEVPSLRLAEIQGINRLAILLGCYPQEFEQEVKEFKPILCPAGERIPAGLPADLLRQRPDVRQAERQLAAQTARIGVATADLYPSFSLSGSFNLVAAKFSDAGKLSSRDYSYGPSLRWNIFDANRVRNNIKAEHARTHQARIAYERAVLTAVQEVEDALSAYLHESLRLEALQRSTAASESSVRLVHSLYQSGLVDFQNVLDAQRTLFNQQDRLAISRGQVALDLIRLYKALGGGWDPHSVESDVHTQRGTEEPEDSSLHSKVGQ